MAEPNYDRLPPAVRRNKEAAEALVAQRAAERVGGTQGAPVGDEPGQGQPPAQPASPAASGVPPSPPQGSGQGGEPGPAAPAGALSDPRPEPARVDPHGSFERVDVQTLSEDELRKEWTTLLQAHRTLQGKYRAEVPRYAAEIRDLKHQLAARDDRISALEQELASAPKVDAQRPADELPAAVPDNPSYQFLVDEFGEKAARHMLQLAMSMQTPVNPQPKPQQPRTETDPAAPAGPLPAQPAPNLSAEQQLEDFVNTVLYPGAYRQIDEDPGFHAWLADFDMREGGTRKQALITAFNGGDIHKAAGFWTDWAAIRRSASAPDPRAQLLEPDLGGGNAPLPPAGGEYIRASEIDQFYKDVSLGKYRGLEQERQQREAEIMAAVHSGRVIQGQ